MLGADIICHIFKEEGVEYVFGVPGMTEVPLLDSLSQTPGIQFLSAVHESVSVAMADGYARVSGKPGVVIVHTAPGTANAIGNMYNAYNAGTPMVVLAGQQDSRLQWLEPFLDADLLPMVSQFTKARYWVGHAQDIDKALGRAFKEAQTPPTGPVFVAVPRDLQAQNVDYDTSSPRPRQVPMSIRPDWEPLGQAARLLTAAKQPAILAGHRVPDADAIRELTELAEMLGAPVYTTTQVPKLIFPSSHPLYFGKVPPLGVPLSGLDGGADVLLAVGSGLFKQIFHLEGPLIPNTTKLIHLDVDPAALGKNCPAEIALMASPKIALAELTAEIGRLMSAEQRRMARDRLEKLKKVRETARAVREKVFEKERKALPLRPSRAFREIARALPPSSIVVDEAVLLTTYIEHLMEFSSPGTYFSSNACLGWGLPAALGVALGTSKRPVVALVGDGSALFGIQALWSAGRYRIPAIMIILNNEGYAAIKWALSMYPDRKSNEGDDLGYKLGDVDFIRLAQGFGIGCERIEKAEQIGPAIMDAIEANAPVLLDIAVDPRDIGYGLPDLP